MPKPLDHVQSFSEVYGDAACVDHESDSCNSPTPKGKPLGYRQGDLVEHGDAGSHDSPTPKEKPLGSSGEHHDDAHALLGNSSTEASSSNFTLGLMQHSPSAIRATTAYAQQHFVYSSQYYSLGHCASTIRGLIYLSQPSSQTNNSYNCIYIVDYRHWGHPPVHDSPVISPQGLDFGNNSVGLDEMLDGSMFMVGQPSEAILDMIEEGLAHINTYLTDLATHSGQPPQQIVDCFLKQYAQLNPSNDWN
ncbi:hypothetical protein EDC04DRAFT_2899392 [Pisolithus marmoratus]|nr:hypothetical protein EDC04DRAFT_2899392 [Pisolithus marmoratus]